MIESAVVERNLDAVRRYLPAFPGEQWLESLLDLFEPHGDYYPARGGPESGARHGRDEIATYLRGWWAAWKNMELELLEIKPVGDDRVFARIRVSAQGYHSGVDLAGDVFICFWLRHGRFIRVEDHLTEKGARWALGLNEEPDAR